MKPEDKHRGSLSGDPRVSRAPGIDRVTLTYDTDTMMCYFYLEEGAKLELHKHIQSQSGMVMKGRINFIKGDGEVLELKAGDATTSPPMIPTDLMCSRRQNCSSASPQPGMTIKIE